MMYWIYMMATMLVLIIIGCAIIAAIVGPFTLLNKWLGDTGKEPVAALLSAAPASPARLEPGVAPRHSETPKEEDLGPREKIQDSLDKMTLMLRERTYELLIREGVSNTDALVLSKAFGTHDRLAVIPYLDQDGAHSEYMDALMPLKGPLQTACHEMGRAVKAGKSVLETAAKAGQEMHIRAGWHSDR